MAREWTSERDAYVDRRIGEGATYARIAGELGITAAAIAGRRQRLGCRSEEALADPQTRAAAALRDLEQSLGYQRATSEGCRWVLGDPSGAWRFCGQAISEGSWCAAHAAAVHLKKGEARR